MNFTTLTALDLGWHLKTGEWILQHLQIPKQDLYSSISPDHPWINLHWGFQIMIYGIAHLGSLWGLLFFKIILLILIYFILFKTIEYKKAPFISSLIFLLSCLTAQERFQLRPELFSFLFIVIYLTLLESETSSQKTRWIWIMPLFQIIWTNIEGLFMIGPGLIGIYMIGQILEKRKPWKLVCLFMLTLSACFVNPYGIQGFLFPFTLLKEISFKGENPFQLIGEFYSPLSELVAQRSAITFFYLLFGLSLICCILNIRRIPKAHFILFLVFSALAFLAQRNIALFAFVAPLIILKNLKKPSSPELPPRPSAMKTWDLPIKLMTYVSIVLVLIFLSVSNRLYTMDLRLERFGLGIAPEFFPQKAIDFLLKQKNEGNMFNSIDFGPAIIYLGWPHLRPFVDTRVEVYGTERLGAYLSFLKSSSFRQSLIEKYKIQTIFLEHLKKDSLHLITALSHDSEWSLIYFDEIAVVFSKNDGNKIETTDGRNPTQTHSPYAHLKQWFPWLPDEAFIPYDSIYLGRFFLALGRENEAKEEYLKVLEKLPQWTEGWINLAYLEEKKKNLSQAVQHLQKALKYHSASYQAHFNLGTLYFKLKRYEEASQEFQKALKIRSTPQVRHNLSTVKKYLNVASRKEKSVK
jgi:tetratricopeptide (TPR) repeat protein